MKRSEFLRAAMLAPLALAGVATPAAPHRHEFDDFVELFYRKKKVREAFDKYVAEDYRQHSAGMAQGREAAIAVLEPMFARAAFHIEPVRVWHDADLLAVILDVRVGDSVRAMVIDLFRHAGGRLREHWDLKFEIPAEQRDHYFEGLKSQARAARSWPRAPAPLT